MSDRGYPVWRACVMVVLGIVIAEGIATVRSDGHPLWHLRCDVRAATCGQARCGPDCCRMGKFDCCCLHPPHGCACDPDAPPPSEDHDG